MLKKINNFKVKPIQFGNGEDKKARGHRLFKEPYSNIFLLAKKRSGKSTTLFRILQKCCSKRTKIVIFCSTVYKDKTYEKIIDYFEKKGNDVVIHTSLTQGKSSLIEQELQDTETHEEFAFVEKPSEPKSTFMNFGEPEPVEILEGETKITKPRKDKYITPEIVFIFDDLGSELRDKNLSDLVKKNRHYKSKVIISSQYMNDLTPGTMKNLDAVLIWGGQSVDKLQKIHQHLDLSLEFEEFIDKYHTATVKQYNFFYIDANSDEYRQNFNHVFT